MRIALIGQEIPTLLPAILADLLFAGGERDAEVRLEEENPAMRDVLQGYAEAILRRAGGTGRFQASGDRAEVLRGADCVLYAGDCQAASRFGMDRSALGSDAEGDPGLTDQARVNGGLGGLLHTLRAGGEVLRLCEAMDAGCPEALVINLGQPVARTTEIFLQRGYRCLGLGRTPLKGPGGLEAISRQMHAVPEKVKATIAGLPGFAFLLEMMDGRRDLMPKVRRAVKNGDMGRLCRRWLDWWDAVAVGDVTDHAAFLPAQEDYIPEERPAFGESVEKRKERILFMNTVREKGAEDREGAMAQLLLLSRVPPIRPMKLALAVLRGETADIPAVTRRNGRELPQLPEEAVIEAELSLREGAEASHGTALPPALAEVLRAVDETNRLAARAATGDRQALRECVETDPALEGLDRLYCMDVVEALIRLHEDVLGDRFG